MSKYVCRALLSVYRALLSVYRALSSVYRALLSVYRALWSVYRIEKSLKIYVCFRKGSRSFFLLRKVLDSSGTHTKSVEICFTYSKETSSRRLCKIRTKSL